MNQQQAARIREEHNLPMTLDRVIVWVNEQTHRYNQQLAARKAAEGDKS